MSEKPNGTGVGDDRPVAAVVPEIRAQRIVIVDEDGKERAVIGVRQGMVELCMGMGARGEACEVMMFAGEHESGLFAAGIEFSANGEAVGGALVTAQGSGVEFEQWPNVRPDGS